MVDFSDREAIEHWLAGIEPAERRREIRLALAARATLRVVPLLGRMKGDAVIQTLVSPTLRVAASAWVAGKYPAHDDALRSASAVAGVALSDALRVFGAGQVPTSLRIVVNRVVDANGTTVAVRNANPLDDVTLFPADFARYISSLAVIDAGVLASSTFSVVDTADAALIDSGYSSIDLVGSPLWPNGAPERAAEDWRTLKSALLDTGEGWEVWTDWYEARLAGDAAHPPIEALEIARATIADEIWKQGPSVVNAEIKRLIAEHEGGAPVEVFLQGRATSMSSARGSLSVRIDGQEPPQPEQPTANGIHGTSTSWPRIESIPEQERTGTRFGMDAQGRIDVLRIPPTTDDLQRFHYEEMRYKAESLAGLGQMLGDIGPAINRILEALPEHIEDATVDKLWSRANTLRRRHDAHVRTVDNNFGPDPARLHPLVAASLGDFIDSFNVYVIGDPRGLELDSIRLGPQDREAARKIAALAEPIARAADEPHSPATPAAQETLTEQVEAAIDAPHDINGDQAAELARKTAGNFVSELLRRAYAPIKKLGAVAKSEAKFAQKEFRAGLYRASGTAAFAGLSIAYWPEIASFVARNADAQGRLFRRRIKILNSSRLSI